MYKSFNLTPIADFSFSIKSNTLIVKEATTRLSFCFESDLQRKDASGLVLFPPQSESLRHDTVDTLEDCNFLEMRVFAVIYFPSYHARKTVLAGLISFKTYRKKEHPVRK